MQRGLCRSPLRLRPSVAPLSKRQRARSAASVAPHDFAKTVKKKHMYDLRRVPLLCDQWADELHSHGTFDRRELRQSAQMWSIVEVLEGLKHIRCVPEHLVLAAQQKAFEEVASLPVSSLGSDMLSFFNILRSFHVQGDASLAEELVTRLLASDPWFGAGMLSAQGALPFLKDNLLKSRLLLRLFHERGPVGLLSDGKLSVGQVSTLHAVLSEVALGFHGDDWIEDARRVIKTHRNRFQGLVQGHNRSASERHFVHKSKVIIRNMKLGRSVFEHRVRTDIPGLRMYADMVLPQFKLIIEFDGPFHFNWHFSDDRPENELAFLSREQRMSPFVQRYLVPGARLELNGAAVAKRRKFIALGYKLLSVPFYVSWLWEHGKRRSQYHDLRKAVLAAIDNKSVTETHV